MLDLTGVVLTPGRHAPSGPQMNVCELIAWLTGDSHSSEPSSVSPALAWFARKLGDGLSPAEMARLVPYVEALMGTVTDTDTELQRVAIMASHAVKVYAPITLLASGLAKEAGDLVAAEAAPEVDTQAAAVTAADAVANAVADAPGKQDPAYAAPAPYSAKAGAAFGKAALGNRGATYAAVDAAVQAIKMAEQATGDARYVTATAEAAITAGYAAAAFDRAAAIDAMFATLDEAIAVAPQGAYEQVRFEPVKTLGM